jgi:hypothetical protein
VVSIVEKGSKMNATLGKCLIVYSFLLSCLFFLAVVTIIDERSKDVVRITLTSADVYGYDLGPFARQLELYTGKEAYAVRLNGTNNANATKWRLVVDDKSAIAPVEG